MLLKVDATSPTPLYEQIEFEIRRAIREGELEQGDRLPPARELAGSLDVNMHTVLRAYGVLRDEGVLEMRRGRGVSVADGARSTSEVRELARQLAEAARSHGFGSTETLRLVEEYLT